MTRFLYQMHIMWYELEMLPETLDSLANARLFANIPMDVHVCFNKQTYLEKPVVDNINEQFDLLAQHPVLKDATIVEKTNRDSFYNVGDWRREVRTSEGYTIWGESDTLLPSSYFPLLEQIWDIREHLNNPHVISFASRKMWDKSWEVVEHPELHQYDYDGKGKSNAPHPLSHDHRITQEQLDEFNSQYLSDPGFKEIYPPKIDGSLLALHPDLPQLIADDMHMIGEDTCAQVVMTIKRISQYHVTNVLKGHNYHHPLKRTNTIATRNEYNEVIRDSQEFEEQRKLSSQAFERYIQELIHEENLSNHYQS